MGTALTRSDGPNANRYPAWGGIAGSGAIALYFGGANANTIAAPNFADPFAFSAPGPASIQPPLPSPGGAIRAWDHRA